MVRDEWWYMIVPGTPVGPVAWLELVEVARAGRIGPFNPLWRDGLPQWVLARDVKALVEEMNRIPPITTAHPAPTSPSLHPTPPTPPREEQAMRSTVADRPGSRPSTSTEVNTDGGGLNWYLEVLRKYAVFSGRARRKEYWTFFLFNLVIGAGLSLLQGIAGIAGDGDHRVLVFMYALAVLVPSIAVTVRRLHDTNRSGWWLLIGLVPVVGVIVLLAFMVQDSQPSENQYGPNPKAAESTGSASSWSKTAMG